MIKKLLAVVAVLSLPALAGTSVAHAADVDVAQSTGGFGQVQPDPIGSQAWFELVNNDLSPYSLAGHSVFGCVGADGDHPRQFVGSYPFGAEIPGFGIVRTADPGFTGLSDFRWDASVKLDSFDYALQLLDPVGQEVDRTTNGNPDQDCVDSL